MLSILPVIYYKENARRMLKILFGSNNQEWILNIWQALILSIRL